MHSANARPVKVGRACDTCSRRGVSNNNPLSPCIKRCRSMQNVLLLLPCTALLLA